MPSNPVTFIVSSTTPCCRRLTSLRHHHDPARPLSSHLLPCRSLRTFDATIADLTTRRSRTQNPSQNHSSIDRRLPSQTGANDPHCLDQGRRALGAHFAVDKSSMSPSLPGFRLPLSPASPPESGIKHQLVDQQTTVAPRTPPSPAHSGMSVATKSYVSSYENNRRTDEMGDRSPPEMYSQPAHRPNANSTPQQNNLKRPIPPDEGDRSFNKRQKKTAAGLDIDEEHSFTATNHDRQNARNGATGGATHEASAAPLGSAPSTDVHAVLGPTRKAFLVGSSSKACPTPFSCRFLKLMLMLLYSSQSLHDRCQSSSTRHIWPTPALSNSRANRAVSTIREDQQIT